MSSVWKTSQIHQLPSFEVYVHSQLSQIDLVPHSLLLSFAPVAQMLELR